MVPKEAYFSKLSALNPYVVPAIVVLVGAGAFGLGRLSALPGRQPLRIVYPEAQLATPTSASALSGASASVSVEEGVYVASRSGSKYYLPVCPGVSRIKQENRIYFVSKVQAEAAGYEPASNCPGL